MEAGLAKPEGNRTTAWDVNHTARKIGDADPGADDVAVVFVRQTYHWNERRKAQEYYQGLEKASK